MTDAPPSGPLHSPGFVAAWRAWLLHSGDYRGDGDYIVLRDLLGRRVYSYLPLLNYTDLDRAALAGRLAALGRPRYHGRALDPGAADFRPRQPVTLRLALPAGEDPEALWAGAFTGKLRNQLRKSLKSGLQALRSARPDVIEDFYAVYARRMHAYGSPPLALSLFRSLPDFLPAEYWVVYRDRRPLAGLVALRDGPLVWVPWAASDPAARRYCPNHFLYWSAIQAACEAGASVFDFGRSPYGGETFRFKSQWGARPVGIHIFTPRPDDVYAKYALAARLWRRLPRALADRLGPRLCPRLPDL